MSGRLDSRDLIAEMEELEAQADEDGIGLDDDELARLEAIRKLADVGIEDWDFGVTLIPHDEFEDYARELAEEIGAVPDDVSWPLTCIDWEQAARELSHDYTSVDFDGTIYYVR